MSTEKVSSADSNFVRTRREELGLTQTQFAARVKISRNYVYMLENNVKPLTKRLKERIANLAVEVPDPDEDGVSKKQYNLLTPSASSASPRENLSASRSPLSPCRYPEACDLPARLVAMEGHMTESNARQARMEVQLQTLLGLLGRAFGAAVKVKKTGS